MGIECTSRAGEFIGPRGVLGAVVASVARLVVEAGGVSGAVGALKGNKLSIIKRQ